MEDALSRFVIDAPDLFEEFNSHLSVKDIQGSLARIPSN
jgi:hypothetical protein